MVQKLATQIFMGASVAFGVLGTAMVLTALNSVNGNCPKWLTQAFLISIFVILPSFAVSVALKYLSNRTNYQH